MQIYCTISERQKYLILVNVEDIFLTDIKGIVSLCGVQKPRLGTYQSKDLKKLGALPFILNISKFV